MAGSSDHTDGLFSSVKDTIKNAVQTTISSSFDDDGDWAPQWSRVDKLLHGRYVLQADQAKLYEMDADGVNDDHLNNCIEEAVQRKIARDQTLPARCKRVRELIKDANGGKSLILERPIFFELADKAYELNIEALVRLAVENHKTDPDEELKREYIILKLGDKVVGPKNFSLLMTAPSKKLDHLIEECPGVRKEQGVAHQHRRQNIPKLSQEQRLYVLEATRQA